MNLGKALPVVLLGLAVDCSRSGLDVLGATPSAFGDDATAGGGFDDGGPSSSGVASSSGASAGGSGGSGALGGSSSGSGSTGGQSSGGINLGCVDRTTCEKGQVCCATVTLSGGLSVTSACQGGPCAPGAYQFCASTSECSAGTSCQPNQLGMGPMICAGDAGTTRPAADAAAACSTPNKSTQCDVRNVLPLTGDPAACGLSVPSPPQALCVALCHPVGPPCAPTCSLRQDAGANEVDCFCDCTLQ